MDHRIEVIWRIVKLFFGIWQIVDMVFDGRQTKRFYDYSSVRKNSKLLCTKYICKKLL